MRRVNGSGSHHKLPLEQARRYAACAAPRGGPMIASQITRSHRTAGRYPKSMLAQPRGTRHRLFHAVWLVAAFTVVVRWYGLKVLKPALGMGKVGPFLLVAQLGVILGVGLFWAGMLRPRDIGWRPRRPVREYALGLVGLAAVTVGLLISLELQEGSARETWGTLLSYSPGERAFFAMIGLQAALVEESLFRGYLQDQLSWAAGTFAGTTLTAVAFAASHLSLDMGRLVSLTFIGLVYGLLRLGGRSLFAPFVAHTLTWVLWGFT